MPQSELGSRTITEAVWSLHDVFKYKWCAMLKELSFMCWNQKLKFHEYSFCWHQQLKTVILPIHSNMLLYPSVWAIHGCFNSTMEHCCQHKCIEAIILVCTSVPLTVVAINNIWMNELKASYWLSECLPSTQQIQRKHMNTQIVHCRSDPVSEVHAGCIWTCIPKYYSLFCITHGLDPT